MAIETEVMNYLRTQLTGLTIREDKLGPSPDDMIVVTREPNSENTIRSDTVLNRLTILTRAKAISDARSRAQSVYDTLHNKSGILTSPTQIVAGTDVPFLIGQDENDRYVFSNNFVVRTIGF